MAAVGLYYFAFTQHKFRKGMLVLTMFLMTLSFAPDEYISQFQSISGEVESDSQYSTGQIRFFMWATAFNAFNDNPIFGVGAGNYRWSVGKYQPTQGNWPSAFFERDRTMQAAHSFYFQLLAEHGLLGIAVFGFLIMRFFKTLRKIVREDAQGKYKHMESWGIFSTSYLALALMGSMIGFLSAGIFLSVLNYPHFFYFVGMGAGLEVACLECIPGDSTTENTVISSSVG